MKTNINVLIFLICTLYLTGCTTLLIGGAGAGGYAVGTDERKASIIAQDVGITASVKATLIKDSQIDAFNINVDTYRGVVTLYGHTKSSAEISKAIRLARTINGVKKVVSKLVVIK